MTVRSFAKAAGLSWVCLVLTSGAIWAQTTFHLHAAASSTPGRFQLQTAGPSTGAVSLMSGPVTVPGDYQVAGFDAQPGVSGTLGYFPTGSQITFNVWMQATQSTGTLYPEAKAYVSTPIPGGESQTLLCSARAGAPLTASLQPFNFSCTTTTNVGMQQTDHLYLWVGAAQMGRGTPTLRAKLSIEGTPGGNYDSTIAMPLAIVPTITSVSPTVGLVGMQVTITGTNFGDGSQSKVTFGSIVAPSPVWSNTSIKVAAPPGASGDVVVSVAGILSNGIGFSDTGPYILSLSVGGGPLPPSVQPGTLLTINGGNFGAAQGGSTITVSDGATTVPATVTSNGWSNAALTITVPRGPTAGNVNVLVTVNNNPSNPMGFTLAPVVDNLAPPSGPVGSTVSITGAGFGGTQGGSTLTFGGVSAPITSWSSTGIAATVPGVPAGPTTVTLTVNGVSVSGRYTVTPNIVVVAPPTGMPGTQVTIAGSSFGATQGSSTVSFSGVGGHPVTATANPWSDTNITVTVPDGAVTGSLTVTVNGVSSNSVPFTVPPPQITALSRNSGPAGLRLKISGNSFGTAQGTVTIGGTPMQVTIWQGSTIWVRVPCAVPSGNITVTRADGNGPSNGMFFTVTSP